MENEIKDSRGDAERQVMSAENETHAAVVAEMRGTDNKCQLATKDGTGCYHCPFGSAASNCLFDKFADRAEAAHKREVEKLNSVIQATVSRSDAEIDRLRRERDTLQRERDELAKDYNNAQRERSIANGKLREMEKSVGNAAKLREAAVAAYDALEKLKSFSLQLGDVGRMREFSHLVCLAKNRLDAALSAPPRNCDVGTARQ